MFKFGDRVRVINYDEKDRFVLGLDGKEFFIARVLPGLEQRDDGSEHVVYEVDAGYMFADDELEPVYEVTSDV